MERIWARAGNALFGTRNAVFPAVLAGLIIAFPPLPLGHPVGDWLLGAGLVVLAAGQVLRVVTIGLKYIKRGGMDRRIFARRLVTGGVFAHCRNPMYVGNVAIAVGLLLVAGHPLAVVTGSVLVVLAYTAIVVSEERYLAARFGAEFQTYCAAVPRWIPKLRGLGRTLRGHRFAWITVIVKEYGTLYATVLLTTGIVTWKTLRAPAGAFPALPWICGGVVVVASIAYGIARFLKKSGRLVAPPSDATPVRGIDRPRARIDEIDATLLELLNERAGQVSRAFQYKRLVGIPRYDPVRTAEIIRRLRHLNRGPLRDEQVERIFSFLLHHFAFEHEPETGTGTEATPPAVEVNQP